VVTQILMPRLSLTMKIGVVSTWFKQEGDSVAKGEPLVEVDTEKVVYEVEAPVDGILHKIVASEGEEVAVAGVLGLIAGADEGRPEAAEPVVPEASAPPREPVVASPAAKRLAREHGIDLTTFTATTSGRITAEDVERYLAQAKAGPKVREVIPLTGIQQVAAERVASSYHEAPHCTLTMDVNMANAIHWSKASSVSYTALLVKLVATALTEHPLLNSTFHGNQITVFKDVNLGVAVATDRGLVVPVVHNADALTPQEVSSALRDLVQRARDGKLVKDEMSGGTFTITNLGMFGVDAFTPIINPPEAAILGVGRIVEKPIVVDGAITIAPMAQLSLSFDHRIVDGAPAASFLARVKALLETARPLE
jgi:pyruvate dehydrogenase E2 component (dihydrolipoamide acetyltransferase)